MHISHIVSTYPPYKGGMGNVAFEMVKGLKKKGYKTSVLTPNYPQGLTQQYDADIIKLDPVFSYGNSAFVPSLYSHLKKTNLIHLHYPFFGGAETVAFFKRNHPDIPLVISYHMDVQGAGLLKAFFQIYRKTFFPWIMNKADTIIVSSKDYTQASNFLSLVKQKNIIELPFGADNIYQPSSRKLDLGKVQLLFVGGLDKAHYFKGLHNLLNALGQLQKQSADFHLSIVGDGDLRESYELTVRKNNLKEKVTFRGKLNDADLVKAYQQADCTILPSVDRSEAFGLVLIESMACGTPVIASNLPGVRSVVDHGKTGFLVEPNNVQELANQVKKLMEDKSLRQEMSQNAINKVETDYRWPKVIDQLDVVYKSLL